MKQPSLRLQRNLHQSRLPKINLRNSWMVIRISDPMAYTCNTLLGRIIKIIAMRTVAVKLEKIFTENIPLMESVFLEIEGRAVPFLYPVWIFRSRYFKTLVWRIWFWWKSQWIRSCRVFWHQPSIMIIWTRVMRTWSGTEYLRRKINCLDRFQKFWQIMDMLINVISKARRYSYPFMNILL